MPGAKDIDMSSFWIEEEVSCKYNYQAVGDTCVKCTAGTIYSNTTKTCDDCPIGFYRRSTDTKCEECPSGKTTETFGSTSSSECIDSCTAGHFFNVSSLSCDSCGIGYYQPDVGRTYCLACAIGKVTRTPTATDEAECFDDCKSGEELKPDGHCVPCEVGTYRKQGVDPVCTQCSADRTTPGEGSKGADACSLAKCPTGQFRVGQGPGTCHDCPLGSYRSASKDNCTLCGDPVYWRTDGVGKTTRGDCKFYCPAGSYIVTDAQNMSYCEGCPQNTYKTPDNYYADHCTNCSSARPRTVNVNSTAESDCRLGNCTVGERLKKDHLEQCIKCGYDTYQPVLEPDNTTECLPCGTRGGLKLGTKQERNGNKSACLPYCAAGEEFGANNMCEPCQRGFYKDNVTGMARFDKCTACSVNLITATTGATSQDNCTQGNCSAGYKTDGASCIPCTQGTYQPEKWQDSCNDCPKGSTTSANQSTSDTDCNVFPNNTRCTFSLTLEIKWTAEYSNTASSAYKVLKEKLLKSIEYLLGRDLADIYKKEKGLKLLALTEGSVVASLETQFIKKDTTGTEVVERVRDVLTTVVKTGQLPAPPGETSLTPLKTVVTALPQVAEIPDGAKS
ncbi:hypothetical protein LSAT2_010524, partial [Lamellibrachia satsuma]